jgi:hypothetical protein
VTRTITNHNTADCRVIAKFKQQKKNKACFEAKSELGKKSLAFLFEEINALKRQLQLKPERLQAVRRETRKAESILSSEINLGLEVYMSVNES